MEEFSREITRIIPALHRFAYRFLKDASDRDDLVQETIAKALSRIETYKPGTNMKSWLFTIMRNTFLTQYQQRKRTVLGLDDFTDMHLTTQPVQEWEVRGHELEQAIAALPLVSGRLSR